MLPAIIDGGSQAVSAITHTLLLNPPNDAARPTATRLCLGHHHIHKAMDGTGGFKICWDPALQPVGAELTADSDAQASLPSRPESRQALPRKPTIASLSIGTSQARGLVPW